MEPTTTEVPAQGGAATQPAQPVDGGTTTAAQPQEPQSQSQAQPAQADDEYAAWLQSKGLSPDSEAAQKAAQMAYNSEKLMTKATQEASELKRSLTPQGQPQPQDGTQGDPMVQEMYQDWKRDKLLSGFKESHQDWQQHEGKMAELLQEPVGTAYGTFTRSQLVNAGLMSLDDVYYRARASAPNNTEQIKQQAQHEVLQTLANTQRAGGGNTHASNSNPQASTEDPIAAAIRKSRG
jgi:hypothetical protein